MMGRDQISFMVDSKMDQSVDPYSASTEPGTMMNLVNLRKSATGRLETREGFQSVALAPTQYMVRGFGHQRQVPCVVDNQNINVYSYDAQSWRVADRAPQWTLDGLLPIAGDTRGTRRFPSSVSVGGVTLHVWTYEDGVLVMDGTRDGVYALVVDDITGAVVRGPEKISPSTHVPGADANCPMLVRCASDGTNVWVVYQLYDSVGLNQNYLMVIPVTAAFLRSQTPWPAGVPSICHDLTTALPSFDISATPPGSPNPALYVAYNRKTATPTYFLRLSKVDNTGTVTASTDIVTGETRTMSISADGSGVWIAYVNMTDETKVRLAHCNATTTALDQDIVAFTVLQELLPSKVSSTGIQSYGVNSATVVASNDVFIATTAPMSGSSWQLAQWNGSALSMFGGVCNVRGCLIASQPFCSSETGEAYCWFHVGYWDATTLEANGDRAYFRAVLARITPETAALAGDNLQSIAPDLAIMAAKAKVGTFSGLSRSSVVLRMAPNKPTLSTGFNGSATQKWDATVVASSSTKMNWFAPPGTFYTPYVTTGIVETVFSSAVRSSTLYMPKSCAHVPTYMDDITVTSGGTQPYMWDGHQFTELGFASVPTFTALIFGGTGNLAAGTYLYAAVYEYTDASGKRHQSAPRISAPLVVTGTPTAAAMNLETLKVTAKQDRNNMLGNVYPNMDPATQIVIYRTLSGPGSIFYRVGTVTNKEDAVSFNDGLSDATIATQPILYTSAGELANEIPPPARHCVVFGKRLACIDAENPERIYFSKPFKDNTAPEFSSALQTYVRGIGPLTALAVLDGTLYAFSATGIAVAAFGAGQDATGGGEWPDPQIITRNAGCSDCRAIGVTPDGVIFGEATTQLGKLRGRLWLLPRGGGVPVEIGTKVRAYLGENVVGFNDASTPLLEITSIVDWPERGRAMISVVYGNGVAPLSTGILEYDYINRGPDGLGTWSFTRYNANSLLMIGSGWVAQNLYWFCSADNNYRNVWCSSLTGNSYLDTTSNPFSSTPITWSMAFHAFKLEGHAPRSKINNIDVELSLYHTGSITMTLVDTTWNTLLASSSFSYTYAGANEPRQHRQWQPPLRRDDTGEGICLALSGDTGTPGLGPGLIPRSVTIDYVPLRGYYRPIASERK